MVAGNPSRQISESEALAVANEAQEPLLIRLVGVLRSNPMLTAGLLIMFLILFTVLVAPLILPDPTAIDASVRLKGPTLAHLFGTDEFGRDIFSRVVMGGKTSLLLAFFSISLAALIGIPVGLIAGYSGGWIDIIFMRILDSVLAFPVMLLAMFVVASLGPGTSNLTITIGFVFMPYFARLVRAQALRLRELQFVEASIQYGTNPVRLLLQVILPNSFAPLLVEFSSSMAFAILTEASLSFLGLGVQPPAPAWGLMLQESQIYLQQALWYAIAPGAAIFLAVLGFNMIGDGLRDVFDPTLRLES